MFDQVRWPPRPWIAVATGSLWLYWSAQAGAGFFLFCALFAMPLLASGLVLALGHHDLRTPQTWAISAALATLLALPAMIWVGFSSSLILLLASAASFACAGREAIDAEPVHEGVPRPERSWGVATRVAVDEALLGFEQMSASMHVGEDLTDLHAEVTEACGWFEAHGYSSDPASFHPAPPPLEDVRRVTRHTAGRSYEHVSFESEYDPPADTPGRDRYLGHSALRTGHAWVRMHAGEDRPWLVCNNGYRLGYAAIDVPLFAEFHERLGMNLLIPVLPFHGPRRVGRISGDEWFTGQPLDTVHAEAQAQWDIRRLIGWIRRTHGATQIGVFGLSLGGYTTALLAGLESGLSCAIPGIAVADFAAILRRHAPTRQWTAMQHVGVDESLLRRLFRPISPLGVEPLVPYDGRLLFSAVSDRLVPPEHTLALHRHWDEPELVWHQGGHVTAPRDRTVVARIEHTLRTTKLCA